MGSVKNKRRVAIILMTVSFVMIISGCVSSFVLGLQADHKKVQKRMIVVSNSFEEFSTNTSLFENARDELYTTVLSNLYYETLAQDDTLIKTKLSNYENMVDEMGKQASKLDKLCDDVYYPDGSVNNKCSNYKLIYEQVVNYFIKDISLYNTNIGKYNNYQASIGSNVLLQEYKTSKKYIDYNNDKEFAGKED